MAIVLKTKESCSSSDKVTPFLSRLVTVGAGHKVIPGVSPTGQLLPPTEFEKYLEAEQWSKMRHDRAKDLVLTFGEEDVRVFKRPQGQHQVKVVQKGEDGDDGNPVRRDRVDVSGLITVPLSEKFKKLQAPESVAAAEQHRKQQKEAEEAHKLEQQRLDKDMQAAVAIETATNANVAAIPPTVTSTPAVDPLSRGPSRKGQRANKHVMLPAATGQEQVTPAETVPLIPPRTWQAMIHRRCREKDPHGSTAFLDELHQQSIEAALKLDRNRPRRRHHRLNCIYHPNSTNGLVRKIAQQTTFPIPSLRLSHRRLIHAIHGAPCSKEPVPDAGDNPEQCFPTPEMQQPRSSSHHSPMGSPLRGKQRRTDGHNSHHNITLSGVSVIDPSTTELPSRVVLEESDSFSDNAPVPVGRAAMRGEGTRESSPVVTPTTAAENGIFNMTQPGHILSLASRSCTPDMTPFTEASALHDEPLCDCTDRSTDEEVDIRTTLSTEREKLYRKTRGNTSTNSTATAEQKAGSHQQPLSSYGRILLNSIPEPLVADQAENALQRWTNGFRLSRVQANSALGRRLRERENHRAYVCCERSHLNLVTKQAETCGDEYRLSRQSRSTTPAGTSMWQPVFSAIEEDRRYLSQTQEKYIEFCDFCASKQFPGSEEEMAFMSDLRSRCMEESSRRLKSKTFLAQVQRTVSSSRPVSPFSNSTPTNSLKEIARRSIATISTDGRRSVSGESIEPSFFSCSGIGNCGFPTVDMSRRSAGSVNHNNSTRPGTGASHSSKAGPPGNRSIFIARREKPQTTDNCDEPEVFSEETASQLIQRHGASLVKTKTGIAIANHLRDMCGMSAKDFLTIIYNKEAEWGPFNAEVALLKKRLQSQ